MPTVSIHAPVKGATRVPGPDMTPGKSFNPRPREGGDFAGSIIEPGPLVSIHAPVKGATSAVINRFGIFAVSIHAPVKGATTSHPAPDLLEIMFQSTPP